MGVENFTNTPDIEFNYALGDALMSVLYVRYPIDLEYSSEKQKHFHDYFELIFVEDGECTFSTNEKVYSLKSGDFVLASPRCEHKFDGVEKCSAYKFGFSFTKINKSFDTVYDNLNRVFSKFICEKYTDDGSLKTIVGQFVASIGCHGEFYRTSAVFTLLLYHLYDRLAPKYATEKYEEERRISGKNSKDVITNALQYYYTTDLSIEEVSKRAFLSTRQINRVCKKIYGRTYNEQRTYFRVENAKKLLKETRKKVVDICLECGFSSVGSFYAAFSKCEGLSPRQYRKKFK